MPKVNYQEACRAMILSGDFSTLTDVLKIAPITPLANSAKMNFIGFTGKMRKGLQFSEKQIERMAAHLCVPVETMKALITNDPLYKKEEPKKKKGDK